VNSAFYISEFNGNLCSYVYIAWKLDKALTLSFSFCAD
jgi:hypothetical protein